MDSNHIVSQEKKLAPISDNSEKHIHRVSYLPHLDGLRAIALIGVLLFHFQVPYFKGGYVGVDVFLSLSGFLITRNIMNEIENGSFSLRKFYVRRFFRLYPASTFTTGVTLLISLAVFPPLLSQPLSKSALSSMCFMSNIFFHMQSGYFNNSSNLKPLLHTWSLSLEEQFYMMWPVLLIFLATRMKNNLKGVITLFGTTSFLFSVFIAPAHPSFAFYELPSRVFQFAAGGILASFRPMKFHKSRSIIEKNSFPLQVARESFSSMASLVLITSYILLPQNALPSHTFIVTISTVIIIALPESYVAKYFLTLPPLRYIGSLAYSAYLVHWPLFVFTRYICAALSIQLPTPFLFLVVTYILSVLLKEGVEDRFRFSAKHSRAIFGAVSILIAGLSVIGILTKGFEWRTSSRKLIDTFPESARDMPKKTYQLCKDGSIDYRKVRSVKSRVCRVGDHNGQRSKYVVFGDSFTGQLLPAFHAIGIRKNAWFELHFENGCRIMPAYYKNSLNSPNNVCSTLQKQMWDTMKILPKNQTILFSNSWWFKKDRDLYEIIYRASENAKQLGHGFGVIEEPPGISPKFGSYFECSSLLEQPISYALQKFGKYLRWDPFKVCRHPEKGFSPYDGRTWQNRAYNMLFRNVLRNDTFVSFFSELCTRRDGLNLSGIETDDEMICRLPVEIPPELPINRRLSTIGYKLDLRHIDFAASYYLSSVLERNLF